MATYRGEDIDLSIPEGVKTEAQRGLDWVAEFNRGGTEVGRGTARHLVNRSESTPAKVRQIARYFPRHEVDKDAEGYRPGEDGYPSNGRIAWALWGGDPGKRWSESKRDQLDRIDEAKNSMPKNKSWFEIKNADGDNPEIFIFDEIGFFGIDASSMRFQLERIPKDKIVNVRINSPGGDVFQALAIYNMLIDRLVTVQVDGIAASAASIVAMAGDPVVMPENAMLMIHNPFAVVQGDSDDMRSMAEALDKVKNGLISTYARKSGMDDDKLWQMLDAETWLTAAEAVELGLADEVKPAMRMAAQFDIGNLPSNVKELFMSKDKTPETQPQATQPESVNAPSSTAANVVNIADVQNIIQACNKAGFPALAARAIAANTSVQDLANLIDEAKAIKSACTIAMCASSADVWIAEGKTLNDVKAALFDQITAENSAFRQQETVQSKAAFLSTLVDQDDAKPTESNIAPDAGIKDGDIADYTPWDNIRTQYNDQRSIN